MTRGKSLSEDIRNSIISAHKRGLSGHKIAKNLSIPQGTVRNIISQFKKTGHIKIKVKSGRISKITKRDHRALRALIKHDRRISSRELASKWADAIGRPISKDTCLRNIKKLGYGFYKVGLNKADNFTLSNNANFWLLQAKEKPLLSLKQKRARLLWVKEHQNWSERQWNSIIWSDESKFEVCVGDPRSRIMRLPEEAFHKDCLKRRVKFPASVMVWGCMSSQGVGRLCFINGTVNAARYQTILQEELLPSIGNLQLQGGEFIFQQDGAACHTAKTVTAWLQEMNIPVLPWPSNSPDLSPIETLWHEMKKALRTTPVRTVPELKSKLTEIWGNFKPEFCQKLVGTMPKRIQAVLKRKGDCTQW